MNSQKTDFFRNKKKFWKSKKIHNSSCQLSRLHCISSVDQQNIDCLCPVAKQYSPQEGVIKEAVFLSSGKILSIDEHPLYGIPQPVSEDYLKTIFGGFLDLTENSEISNKEPKSEEILFFGVWKSFFQPLLVTFFQIILQIFVCSFEFLNLVQLCLKLIYILFLLPSKSIAEIHIVQNPFTGIGQKIDHFFSEGLRKFKRFFS